MSKTGLGIVAAVAVITLLGLVYLALTYEPPQGTTTVILPSPAIEPEQPAPEETTEPESDSTTSLPSIRLQPQAEPPAVAAEPEIAPAPVQVEPEPEPEPAAEEVGAEESIAPLPPLNNSDGFIVDGLRALENGADLVRYLADAQLARRFVTLVDNISQGDLPQSDLPYRAIGEEMPVRQLDDNLFVMGSETFSRFDALIASFMAIDTDAAMTFYRTLSPLFQQAYAELGYGDRNFDATLADAIDVVLDARIIEGPFQLVEPSVMYLYADASIENLSAVHKQLLRLGPENAAQLKSKLRQFRDRL